MDGEAGKSWVRDMGGELRKLHEEYVASVHRWLEIENTEFELFLLRMEGLVEERHHIGEEMGDLESRSLCAEAEKTMDKADRVLQGAQRRWEKRVLDLHRTKRAKLYTVRVMSMLLARMGSWPEGAIFVSGGEKVVAERLDQIWQILAKMWIGSDPENRAKYFVGQIVCAIQCVLRSGRVEWSAAIETDLVTLTKKDLEEKYGTAPGGVTGVDRLLVQAFRPDWRVGDWEQVQEPSSKSHIDWKDVRQVAVELVSAMGHDNGCTYLPTADQMMRLCLAVEVMMASDFVFTAEVCLDLTAGEESEVEERYGGVDGFSALNIVLNQIFDGPSSP